MEKDLFKGYGIRVNLKDEYFNIVKETLTRIGIPSYRKKSLTQTCHIFHRQNNYAICHFKEMLAFDGKNVDISEEDLNRRDLIVKLLEEWNLIESIDEYDDVKDMLKLKVISSKEKNDWEFCQKYTIGKKLQKT
jgi:hypothetical protein